MSSVKVNSPVLTVEELQGEITHQGVCVCVCVFLCVCMYESLHKISILIHSLYFWEPKSYFLKAAFFFLFASGAENSTSWCIERESSETRTSSFFFQKSENLVQSRANICNNTNYQKSNLTAWPCSTACRVFHSSWLRSGVISLLI